MDQLGKKDLPLVSVGIVTYNQKDYLRECIESVLLQDYPNFEIVIGDDGSTDGSQEWLQEFALGHPGKCRVVLSSKNTGITNNANAVFFSCKGEYVAMLGGDDLMLPGKIRKQVAFLESHTDYVLCGTYTQLIDQFGEVVGLRRDYRRKRNPSYTLYDQIESGNGLVPVVSYMFRRNAAPPTGYDIRLPVVSDGHFISHISRKGNIYILKEVLTAYRVHNRTYKQISYTADALVSHALCEFYFPDCGKAIYRRKSKTLRNIGIRNVLNDDFKTASHYFKMSVYSSFSVLTLIMYAITLTGPKVLLKSISNLLQRRWL
jgi:glycosyltransferase involved in cell wall biosynthesis